MYPVSDPLVPSVLIIIVAGLILALISILLSASAVPHFFPAFVTTKDSTTVLSLGSAFASSATPKLSNLTFHIQEFIIPGNNDSIPLYPLYDKNRDVIWTGDTQIDSSKILELNLTSDKFTEHKLNGTSIVTVMAFDQNDNNQIWYVDPLLKHLGHYDPSANSTKLYDIPTQGIVARIAIDLSNNVWLTSPDTNEILKFDTKTKNFTMIHLPTINAMPIGILVDKTSGLIWIAEGIGNLASIDPTRNYKINEYHLKTANGSSSTINTHFSPTEILMSTLAGNDEIYVSDHDNHTVSVFDVKLKTFKTLPVFNPEALPFGMAIDRNGYIWVAEHTTNKIAVIDPKTGSSREVEIPKQNPYVQFLTSDSKGNIWFAEQQGNSLGVITSTSSATKNS